NPQNKNEILAGFADGGVWKTLDQGANWTPIFDFQPVLTIGAITAFDPPGGDLNNATIYIATGEGNFNGDAVEGQGVFKSTDGGNVYWTDLLLDSSTVPTTVYAANGRVSNPGCSAIGREDNGVYRSTDNGATWVNISTPNANCPGVVAGTTSRGYSCVGSGFAA